MPQLVLPSIKYRKSYLKALREFHQEGLNANIDYAQTVENFKGLITYFENFAKGVNLPYGYVPTQQFWLVEGKTYLGRIDVRKQLNVYLQRIGGHVSYQIRPTKRKMGYGRVQLGLVLEEVKKMGLHQLLITCRADNFGSQKIITHWRGKFLNAVERPDTEVKEYRYLLEVAEGLKVQ